MRQASLKVRKKLSTLPFCHGPNAPPPSCARCASSPICFDGPRTGLSRTATKSGERRTGRCVCEEVVASSTAALAAARPAALRYGPDAYGKPVAGGPLPRPCRRHPAWQSPLSDKRALDPTWPSAGRALGLRPLHNKLCKPGPLRVRRVLPCPRVHRFVLRVGVSGPVRGARPPKKAGSVSLRSTLPS